MKEHRDSPEWNRIQAKLWCSLPSAELVSLQRVENQKLWRAFEAPVTEYRDAGGHVHVGHHASGVEEVWHYKYWQHVIALPRQYHSIKGMLTL